MDDYVICRCPDESGVVEIYGPYSETKANLVIEGRPDRATVAYYAAVLHAPNELETTK